MRSRRYRSRRVSTIPEVSLTPLIDTALTLLIIFMVTAPMVKFAIKVDLPKGSVQEGNKDQQELIVSIDEKGAIYLNDKAIQLAQIGQEVKDYFEQKNNSDQKSVWVRVHGATTTCDTLVAVIDRIKGIAGVKDVRIATQQASKNCA